MKKDVIMPRLNPRILSTERQFIEMNEFGNLIYLFYDYLSDRLHTVTVLRNIVKNQNFNHNSISVSQVTLCTDQLSIFLFFR
jgi:hypothetical protein